VILLIAPEEHTVQALLISPLTFTYTFTFTHLSGAIVITVSRRPQLRNTSGESSPPAYVIFTSTAWTDTTIKIYKIIGLLSCCQSPCTFNCSLFFLKHCVLSNSSTVTLFLHYVDQRAYLYKMSEVSTHFTAGDDVKCIAWSRLPYDVIAFIVMNLNNKHTAVFHHIQVANHLNYKGHRHSAVYLRTLPWNVWVYWSRAVSGAVMTRLVHVWRTQRTLHRLPCCHWSMCLHCL